METLIGKLLSDVSAIASRRWYAALGAGGLAVLIWALVAGTPHDDGLIAAIGFTMACAGFGEGETRTQIEELGYGFKKTTPVRRLNGPSVVLFTLALCGGIFAVVRALW